MLLFSDSFDHYSTTELDFKWSSHVAFDIGAYGRNGTNGGRSTRTDRYVRKNLSTNYATLIFGFSFQQGSNQAGAPIITLLDAGSSQVHLTTDASNRLQVRRGNVAGSGGRILGTGTQVLSLGVNYYIEFKATINNATGVAIVKVNGITDINLSGQDTQETTNATADGFVLCDDQGQFGVGFNRDFDDFYCCDDSGSYNNTFLGDVRIQAILPSGAGTTTSWTPSAGSNYQNVDESSPDGDTTYNSDATPGDIDTYAFGNLVPTTGNIKAVVVYMYARKDDAGVRTIAPVIRDGGTNYVGTSVNIGTTYTYYSQIYEVNPNSGVAFTVTEVNADEYGIKLVA